MAGEPTELPPPEQRLFSGIMHRMVHSSRGMQRQTRFAVLSAEHLSFARHLEDALPESVSTHLPSLRISTNELWEVFSRHDCAQNGFLQRDEAAAALQSLNLVTTVDNFEALFKLLDLDCSGTLDWEEFKLLVKQAASANSIWDFIPLEEVEAIEPEVISKVSDGIVRIKAAHSSSLHQKPAEAPASFLASFVKQLEKVTGVDMDGEGRVQCVPPFNPETQEVQIVLTTAGGGHNSGGVFAHVVDPEQAQAWLNHLTAAVRDAKLHAHRRKMEEIYGHSRLSMARAKTMHLYQSNAFQCVVAFIVVAGFVIDIAEAQVMPSGNSEQAWVFMLLDFIVTGLFTIELTINILAHSNDGCRFFFARWANAFDTLIVAVSITNIILVQANVMEFPNARLLRLARVGRVVRLVSSLRDLQKILSACSSAILPVCNAFFILLIVASVFAIVGTNVFAARSPEYFGNFHTSLFTLFQVLSGDSWASAVARSIFQGRETEPDVAFFFTTFLLINGVMLLNLVVAVRALHLNLSPPQGSCWSATERAPARRCFSMSSWRRSRARRRRRSSWRRRSAKGARSGAAWICSRRSSSPPTTKRTSRPRSRSSTTNSTRTALTGSTLSSSSTG